MITKGSVKLKNSLAKQNKKYIIQRYEVLILAIVWRVKPTKAYEPCQVRKEAAISGYFCVVFILHRVANEKELCTFLSFTERSRKMAYTALCIENLDH